MKAFQVLKPRQFTSVDLAQPIPGPHEILVRLQKAVICGSDIPAFVGTTKDFKYPLPVGVPLHESVGEVIESNSDKFKPGDVVVAIPKGLGALAQAYVSHEDTAVKVPETLLNSDISPIIQPLSTVIYAVDKLGNVEGQSVIVLGLGSIGLLASWLLKKRGAASIIGIDPIAWRGEQARQVGVERSFALTSSAFLHIAQTEAIPLADIVFEAVGHQTRSINDSLHLVKRNGTVLAFGVPDATFIRQNIRLIASIGPDWKVYLPQAAELLGKFGKELEFLITHRFNLDKLEEAYALYAAPAEGRSIKILIDAKDW
jgi:threonine dehydrogenase-like Zn-dependent dehydrogenase